MSHYMTIIAYQSNHSLWYWNFFMHNLRNKSNKFTQIFFISMFNNTFKRIFVTISQTTQETFHSHNTTITKYYSFMIILVYILFCHQPVEQPLLAYWQIPNFPFQLVPDQ